jgi:hypothetical protein
VAVVRWFFDDEQNLNGDKILFSNSEFETVVDQTAIEVLVRWPVIWERQ